mmetsp:Transcript_44133/g.86587  ORF Transcript_44133/g.86587 Transcript_44133/m.86587 type:complete len:99 (-) Transcript_44133:212-508(-)|eukprot:CAMPEP_0194278276 /NCGR_PEP_ID=MMETSP0169-20130528/10368_1 /TAXON_ID=218684 /ORGANISM="Corethron pennatum, Strain L29A3" /LENGTH=98 /DNA_ID=CAMNT_0039022425 /DNA_START=230 /DNA_END=526 /DNA_ORIENTATION=+
MPPKKSKKVMTQPINVIFRYLQNKTRVLIWLQDDIRMRLEGTIIGFDEYMNLTLDDTSEIDVKKGTNKPLGRILLKGDTITLMQEAKPVLPEPVAPTN